MTPVQQRVYAMCVADHDRLRSRKTPRGFGADAFSRAYNLGYEFPTTPAGRHPRPLADSIANAAFRASRDRRRRDERELRRAVRSRHDLVLS